MMTACLAIFVAFTSVQALLVLKLADFLTDGADPRGTRPSDVRRAGIA